jgi:hypothetical protein
VSAKHQRAAAGERGLRGPVRGSSEGVGRTSGERSCWWAGLFRMQRPRHKTLAQQARPGDLAVKRRAAWGMSDRKASSWSYKAHVNLGFFQGAHLPYPAGLLEGTGKTLRHVKLRLPEEALAAPIRDLIAAARDERRAEPELLIK